MAVHLFTGDQFLREREIDRLKGELRSEDGRSWREITLDGEAFSLKRCLEAIGTGSLFDEGILIHVRRVEHIPQADGETVAEQLKRPLPPDRWLVLEGERLDRQSALYRAVERAGAVHHLPSPDRRTLPKLTRELLEERGLTLPPRALRYLLESVEGDLARIGSEVEKLALYAKEEPLSERELAGLLFHDRGGNLFACLDALLARRPEAVARLTELLEGGEDAGKAFFVLATQVRGLLRVKSLGEEGRSLEEIARRTGDYKWRVSKRLKLARGLETEELIGLIHRLHREDVRIKRGEREPEGALWAILVDWVFGAKTDEGAP